MTIQVHIVGTSVPCCGSSFGSASAYPNAVMLPLSAQTDNFHSKVNLCARPIQSLGYTVRQAEAQKQPGSHNCLAAQAPVAPRYCHKYQPFGQCIFTAWSMHLHCQMPQGRQEQSQGRTVHHAPLLYLLPSRKAEKLERKGNRSDLT